MRLKLVLLASLIAALVGVGLTTAIILLLFSSLRPVGAPGLLVLSTYSIPMLAVLLAAIFVYRHTARRRRLQAILTVLISLVLTVGIFLVLSFATAPTLKDQTPPISEPPRNAG